MVAVASTIAKLYVTDWTDRAEKEDDDKIKKEDNYKFFIKYSSILFAGVVIQLIKEFLVDLYILRPKAEEDYIID